MRKKHFFLICKIHNRACFGGVWMDINHFISVFISNNIRNDECKFTEIECDDCEKEMIKNADSKKE